MSRAIPQPRRTKSCFLSLQKTWLLLAYTFFVYVTESIQNGNCFCSRENWLGQTLFVFPLEILSLKVPTRWCKVEAGGILCKTASQLHFHFLLEVECMQMWAREGEGPQPPLHSCWAWTHSLLDSLSSCLLREPPFVFLSYSEFHLLCRAQQKYRFLIFRGLICNLYIPMPRRKLINLYTNFHSVSNSFNTSLLTVLPILQRNTHWN